eukprot:1334735-Prymnesium_polylepis.2
MVSTSPTGRKKKICCVRKLRKKDECVGIAVPTRVRISHTPCGQRVCRSAGMPSSGCVDQQVCRSAGVALSLIHISEPTRRS